MSYFTEIFIDSINSLKMKFVLRRSYKEIEYNHDLLHRTDIFLTYSLVVDYQKGNDLI